MATAKKITAEYKEFIAREVINKFGGSYQTYETLGKTWRQEMPYRTDIDDFLIMRSKLFLNFQDMRDQNNLNMMYRVSCNIADHLSKYISKKTPSYTRQQATESVFNKLFLHSQIFNNKFQRIYKKPIDLSNEKYVESNPGVVALYKNQQQLSK